MDKDPYTSDQQRQRDQYELDDENWYEVVFEEVNGSSTAKLALHNDWINQKGYQVDGVVEMNLPEQGISGPFRITAIKHLLPQKRPEDKDAGKGFVFRPVTGIFTHQSNDVWILEFDSGDTLGVTASHPIYTLNKVVCDIGANCFPAYMPTLRQLAVQASQSSVYSTTAQDWRLAGELAIGEQVLTHVGSARLTGKRPAPAQLVYNLEVREVHNFLVTGVGVVVHNGCVPPVKPLLQNMTHVFNNWVSAFPTVVRQATTDYYQYQQRILGTLTERRIPLKQPHNFTRDNIDVDGFEPSTGTLIDTKYVRNPSSSPYTGGSSFPPIQDELLDELKRYKHIIDDVETPARDLKIVTNHPDAKTYLENLMNSLNIPGGVVIIE